MGFWNQLVLLLWKNFALRKHQYMQTITEICWPLVLFFILMFIRLRKSADFVDECHYLEKALPSAGFIPVIQTYICTFNNTCFNRKHWNDSEIGVLKTSVLTEVIQRFALAMDDYNPIENPITNMTKIEIVDWLNATEPAATALIVDTLNEIFGPTVTKDILAKDIDTFCTPGFTIMMESYDIPQNAKEARKKLCKHLKPEENERKTIEGVYQYINSSIQKILEENKDLKGEELAGVIFSRVLCGPYFPSVFEMFSEQDQSLEPLESSKISDVTNRTADEEPLTATFTEEQCEDFFKLTNNKNVNFVSKVIIPFIRGKILYYPKTNITDRLIKRMNQSFGLMFDLFKFSELWVTEIGPILLPSEKSELRSMNLTRKIRNIITAMPLKKFSRIVRSFDNGFPESGNPPETTNYSEIFDILNNLTKGFGVEKKNYYLDLINIILKNIYKYLSCFDFDRFIGMSSPKEMIKMSIKLIKARKFFAAIEFVHPEHYKGEKLPKLVIYKLRTDAQRVDSTRIIQEKHLYPHARANIPYYRKYTLYGFMHLQDLIEHCIIELQTGQVVPIGMWVQHLPYPCHYADSYLWATAASFPLFMSLSWVYTCSMMIKNIVYEKEHRLKEVMKTMGLDNGVHWAGWFLNALGIMLTTDVLLTLILSVGRIIRFTDITIVFLLLFCNTLASITLSFLISTFYFKANLAAAGGGIIYFMTYLPFPLMSNWLTNKDDDIILTGCLFSNVAFGYACTALANWELLAVGLQWRELSWDTKYFEKLSFLKAIAMLLFDSVIYCILTWYIESVFPGEYGIPKPWYFPLQFFSSCFIVPSKKSEPPMPPDEVGPNVEPEPSNLSVGVQIINLRKVFGDGKIGIHNLSINFYEGQISSFLGHNGAGKTTTINILSGLFPPTSGTVVINGLDIQKDLDAIHTSMGVCPQFNVLFEYLTVEEHLWFYSSLKNFKHEKKLRDIDAMIQDLKLPHKRKAKASTLSGISKLSPLQSKLSLISQLNTGKPFLKTGGTQRKLSLGCAFIGGSKIIILDEPTAGVDPYARRAIWNLLLKYKKGRTIIISTHFMDEADILGDRIAIIANGKLCCCGSSLFLKRLYGTGYHLIISKVLPPKQKISEINRSVTDKKSEEKISDTVDLIEEEQITREEEEEVGEEEEKISASDTPELIDEAQITGEEEKEEKNNDNDRADLIDEAQITGEEEESSRESENPEIADNPDNIKDARMKFGVASDSRMHAKRSDSKEGKITPFIRRFVPNVKFVQETRSELNYILPPSDNKAKYIQLLQELDKNLATLEISSYGISDSTLEEIFLSVVENAQIETLSSRDFSSLPLKRAWVYLKSLFFKRKVPPSPLKSAADILESDIPQENLKRIESGMIRPSSASAELDHSKQGFFISKSYEKPLDEDTDKLVGLSLVFQQYIAILIKRYQHNRRNFKAFFCEIILPCCFITTALLFTLIYPNLATMPPLELIPWLYKTSNVIFYSDVDKRNTDTVAKKLETSLIKDPGIGIRCMKPEPLPKYPCKTVKKSPFLLLNKPIPERYPNCSCELRIQHCNDTKALDPPTALMKTTDYLVNMTNRNVSKWIVTTHIGPTDPKRGGFTLGLKNQLARVNQTNLQRFLDKTLENQIDNRYKIIIKNLAKNFTTGTKGLGVIENIRVWFYNQAFTSSVTYLNVINNAMLRAYLPKGEDPKEYGIFAINHPINQTHAQLVEDLILKNAVSLLQGICIVFAMSFVPASFVLFYVEERISRFKHLQFISGVKPTVYWVANFSWDLTLYGVSASCCVIIFLIFNERAYASSQNLHGLIILLFSYGVASIPLMYPASFIFSIPSFAFVALACGNLFIGTITIATTFGLNFMGLKDLEDFTKVFQTVFLIFPQYCLGQGLIDMTTNQFNSDINKIFDLEIFVDPLTWNVLGRKIFVMIMIGIIFFTGVLLWDNYLIWKPKPYVLPKYYLSKATEKKVVRDDDDEDVGQERAFVMSEETGDTALLLENLTKIYLRKKNIFSKFLSRFFSIDSHYTLAVDQLCLALYPGECFGLLGVNGAGKTSTFKMLTGEESISSGDARLTGYSVRAQLDHVRQNLGYCPQFDALDNLLTSREHLMFFARIRGIQRKKLKETTTKGIEQLGLEMQADQKAGTYSGGNKRKLSTAIALIGEPPVIFLDEPTTGMDPKARRFLWNCVLDTVQQGKLVVITSHSMEECEVLCSRLGIMVNGRFQCLGSVQHLKNRFGGGYMLSLSVDTNVKPLSAVMSFIEEKFPMAVLKDSHYNYLSYQLPTTGWKLSDVFREMEEASTKYGIETYSLQQTTLDQVFVSFAKQQRAGESDVSSTTTVSPSASSSAAAMEGKYH